MHVARHRRLVTKECHTISQATQRSVTRWSVTIGVLAFLITLVTFGLGAIVIVPLAIVVGIAYVVLIILATVKAANGEDYRYPFTIRLVS